MMRKSPIYKYLFIFLFLFSSGLFCQIKDSIKQKNQQLQSIRDDISNLERELKSKSRKERESLQSLENINKQNLLLGKLINNLLVEEKQKEQAIGGIEQEVQTIEKRIKNLKTQYSRYIVWFYKNSGLSMWRFILDAESFNQALVRYQYLKYISRQNKITLDKLTAGRAKLSGLQNNLEIERKAKEILANKKLKEQDVLEKKEKEKKGLISVLKKDQKMIADEINLKRRAEILIKNIIAKLIEADREAKKRSLESKVKNDKKVASGKLPQSFDYSSFQNFAQLRGSLGWPVKEGRIVRKFGENKNERLKTVTLNYGIDIGVGASQNVLSVAEGIVSAIDWIPGYGSIVIVTHRDDFRTVYGHVTGIAVKEGDRIKAGSTIGKVSESLEGNIVHFEIWNERNYQNPEIWLSLR
ncbi:MAG: peptidoglycan DD-metalloendopeptidase family protein [Ignavibacteriales bacterium]|nr:peptidoglycan DD-metalloendopeptidase family protein [Ignavibacteriales bacterium]